MSNNEFKEATNIAKRLGFHYDDIHDGHLDMNKFIIYIYQLEQRIQNLEERFEP